MTPANRAVRLWTIYILVQYVVPSSSQVHPVQLRLANNVTVDNALRGRLEVLYDGQWGTVCDDMFGDLDATVACHQLGYDCGTAFCCARFGEGSGPITMDNVRCSGHERALSECQHNGFRRHNCGHREDVGVECRRNCNMSTMTTTPWRPPTRTLTTTWPPPTRRTTNWPWPPPTRTMPPPYEPGSDGMIRLVGGREGSHEGRVEIFINDQWGTVCDDYWDDVDASVVCRQLNFTEGRAVRSAFFGRGSGPIHMDDVRCRGSESRLIECRHTRWDNCGHWEDAGVVCTVDETPDNYTGPWVRVLPFGVDGYTHGGSVELYQFGAWKPLCADFRWNVEDARVMCRELGFAGGLNGRISITRVTTTPTTTSAAPSFPDFARSLSCLGNEESSRYCIKEPYPPRYCREKALLYCLALGASDDTVPQVRLVGGPNKYAGRVEVGYGDLWGSSGVLGCRNNSAAQEAARMTCQHLGFRGGTVVFSEFPKSTLPLVFVISYFNGCYRPYPSVGSDASCWLLNENSWHFDAELHCPSSLPDSTVSFPPRETTTGSPWWTRPTYMYPTTPPYVGPYDGFQVSCDTPYDVDDGALYVALYPQSIGLPNDVGAFQWQVKPNVSEAGLCEAAGRLNSTSLFYDGTLRVEIRLLESGVQGRVLEVNMAVSEGPLMSLGISANQQTVRDVSGNSVVASTSDGANWMTMSLSKTSVHIEEIPTGRVIMDTPASVLPADGEILVNIAFNDVPLNGDGTKASGACVVAMRWIHPSL